MNEALSFEYLIILILMALIAWLIAIALTCWLLTQRNPDQIMAWR